jgi:hypothetical protein
MKFGGVNLIHLSGVAVVAKVTAQTLHQLDVKDMPEVS